ncbi:11260_t:CDS:2 [Ambispora leptoticha]|uniref:11260_t:CDS:1 n=1 Tax=Ambispora leptoticha TaxID=144679 RepID=A0A9N8VAY3_9GLOM|nr:11260_t:CDS:2 [Ambispora leptoticha]
MDALFGQNSLDDTAEPARTPDDSDVSEGENLTNKEINNTPAPISHGGRQTGPKGVLADHAFHEQISKERKAAFIKSYNERVLSKAITTTTFREDQETNKQEEALLQALENVSSDEDEQEVIRRYREQRIKEIKNYEYYKSRPKFGFLKEISADQYVSAIDNEAANVSVVLHLYENSIVECIRLNECLAHLARKYACVKFLRILARELEFDPAGLPAILVYKNGKLIANLVKITDEFDESDFDSNVVEQILIRKEAFTTSDISPDLSSTKNNLEDRISTNDSLKYKDNDDDNEDSD